ncbi:MAG: hypothetical protein P4L87_14215 [Formivibrio sp.]|nr:hypothetical protein [Formivibrio sp.]
MKNNFLSSLPLIVGVTGHIDIVDEAIKPLQTTVRRLLGELKGAYKHTSIQAISALAEGADQLVAYEARALGFPLVAVLPMPLVDYEQTLTTAAGRQHMRELWEAAELRIELPWLDGVSETSRDALQYEQVGLVIAHFSHVLLALWNGAGIWDPEAPEEDRLDQQGGTAHIAYLRAIGERESEVFGHSPIFPSTHTRLYPVDHGLTFRIATPRRKTDGCVGEAGSLWFRSGEAGGVEVAIEGVIGFEDVGLQGKKMAQLVARNSTNVLEMTKAELSKLDKANSLLMAFSQKSAEAVAQSAECLLPNSILVNLGGQRLPADAIRQAYALADAFSQANQRRIYRAILGIVLALLAAVLAYEIYAYVQTPEMLFAYLAVIVTPAIIHWTVIRRLEWQNHFQDFRAIAEALRVQFFWGLAGVSCGVTDFYLRKHHDEMNWIRLALRGPALQALAMGLGPVHRDLVKNYWIEDQFSYFSGTSYKGKRRPGQAEYNKKKHGQYNLWASVAYGTGLLIALALLVTQWGLIHIEDWARELAIILMGFAPALAGALSIISEKRAYKDHAHQYSRMGRFFGNASTLLAQVEGEAGNQFAMIVRDLGAEALA